MKKKTILFLSALDFKEKSIQVIRKTPEAYVKAGWDVNYIVIRDNSKYDNYYYENEINPVGVNIIREYLPLEKSINKFGSNRIVRRVLQKIAYFLAVLKLFIIGKKFLQNNKVDIIYGYEVHGVLAVNLLKLFRKLNKVNIISRFQGTFMYEYFQNKKILKIIGSYDHLISLALPSNLCIMTDDGTQGNKALEILKSKNLKNYKFWPNGVDEQKLENEEVLELKNKLNPKNKPIFLTVCRLEYWKRVDRGLRTIAILKAKYNIKDFIYYIVGEGVEKDNLLQLCSELNINDNVIFTGAIPNVKVKEYLNVADFFLSMYDSSNVGNPLLEAIRSNKIIFTLNTGDTKRWIQHKENGFIYDVDSDLYSSMADDIFNVINNKQYRTSILEGVQKTESEELWTWDERLSAEIKEVRELFD
ncbi:MAG: glycosyltransferase [Campylobacterota bacterium]|nr:glycosyltransferase [Campylobacterota bacterium]